MSKSLNDMYIVPKVPIVPDLRNLRNLRNYIEYRINNRVIRYSIPHYQQSLQSIHRQSIHRQLPIPLQYIQYYPQQYHTKATQTVSYKNKNNIDVL